MNTKRACFAAIIAGFGVGAGYGRAETVTKTFDATGIRELDLSNGAGKVNIGVAEDGKATIVANKIVFGKDCDLAMAKTGTTLIVEAKDNSSVFSRSKCEVDFTITLPRNIALNIKNGSGAIKANGIKGNVAFKTGSGPVELDGEITRLSGKSGSGSVRVVGLTGDGDLDAGSGDISVTYKHRPASGNLGIKNGSGDTTVYLPSETKVGASFRAGSGWLTNELGNTPNAPFTIEEDTGSGSLSIKKGQ